MYNRKKGTDEEVIYYTITSDGKYIFLVKSGGNFREEIHDAISADENFYYEPFKSKRDKYGRG